VRRKILVVDSSETILTVCRTMLTRQGYEISVFQDGTEALAELKRSDYDLAIIATSTENVPGHFIVQELRKDPFRGKTPVLMLLGSSELMDARELLDVGPDDTLNKPFSPQELLFAVQKLMESISLDVAAGDDIDLESILTDDTESLDKKVSNVTDKILDGVFLQEDKEQTEDSPELDQLEIAEDAYDLESKAPDSSEDQVGPHDYDWFIKEMSREESSEQKATTPKGSTGTAGKFQIQEIGTAKITLDQNDSAQKPDETKAKVYIEKPDKPSASVDTTADVPQPEKKPSQEMEQIFIKEFAQALAREIGKQIDFDKLVRGIKLHTDRETRE